MSVRVRLPLLIQKVNQSVTQRIWWAMVTHRPPIKSSGRQIWYHRAFPTKDGRHAVDRFVYRLGEIARRDLWFPKPEIPAGACQQRAGLFEPRQVVGHNDADAHLANAQRHRPGCLVSR